MIKTSTRKRMHRWFGLALCLFLINFCVSGIILNHSQYFSKFSVPRALLPGYLQLKQWNQGLLRGTVRLGNDVLIYGSGGVWRSDTLGRSVTDYNRGLPEAAGERNVRAMCLSGNGVAYAVTDDSAYQLRAGAWHALHLPDNSERLVDVAAHGKQIVVLGRSFYWNSTDGGNHFTRYRLRPASNSTGKVSLMRTVWLLHSGALFGTAGKLVGDAVAVVLLVISVTGVWFFFARKVHAGSTQLKRLWHIHRKLGRATIVLTVLITLTGWLLRPPGLIAIVYGKVKPVPFSVFDNNNTFTDQLRRIAYDDVEHEWLLYTSSGFYHLKTLGSVPQPLYNMPKVSFMGLTAFKQVERGRWLVGSFDGLYLWNRHPELVPNPETGMMSEPVEPLQKDVMLAGFSNNFAHPVLADYYSGSIFPKMPAELSKLPMSLPSVCLEVHTGRIYTFLGGSKNLLYICLIGLAILWCLYTGYYRPRRLKKKTPKIKKQRKRLRLETEPDDNAE